MGTTKRERQKTLRQARLEAAHAAQRRQHIRRRVFVGLGVVAVIALVAVGVNTLFLSDDDSGGDSEEASDSTSTTAAGDLPAQPTPPGPGASITGATPCPPEDGSAERTTTFEQAPPTCLVEGADYTATFVTNRGDITVDLTEGLTPGAVNNFVTLANYGYYDDTAIFRTDPSIGIIQGGSPTTNTPGDPGPGYTIPDEGNTFTYAPGQLVMARSADENSTGAQYFFVVNDAASALDAQGNYIVIGQADEASLAVLQQILDLHITDPTSDLGGGPIEEVIVEDVVISQA
jgi:cyclophilin family peptidyl-prolyl cis-trans isomerase